MYCLSRLVICGNIIGINYVDDGFMLGSKNKAFSISSCSIKNIIIYSKTLALKLCTDKVMNKYNKLIAYLTDLLIDDDDSGDSLREVLNQIEKFRLEIKIKYRNFLKKKELEMMAKQLVLLQKEANDRLLEIHDNYVNMMSSKRSK